MDDSTRTNMKRVLRESDIPFFTNDDDLDFYFAKNNNDFNATVYECLLIKAENTSLSISGLTSSDTSAYFRRMASRYRPNHSGVLQGGY